MLSLFNRIAPEFSKLFRLAFPIMISRAMLFLLTITDFFVLGLYSNSTQATLEQSLLSTANIIVLPLVTLVVGLGLGTQIFIARSWGRADYSSCYDVSERMIIYNIILGIASILMTLLFLPIVLANMDMKLAIDSSSFNHRATMTAFVLSLSNTPVLLISILYACIEGVGKPRVCMSIAIISGLLNLLLNFPFIFGLEFKGYTILPSMGAFGSALSSLIVNLFMLFTLLWVWFKVPEFQNLTQRRFIPCNLSRFVKDFRQWSEIRSFGYFTSTLLFIQMASAAYMKVLIASEGPEALVAFEALMQTQGFIFKISMALGVAASIQISFNLVQGEVLQTGRTVFVASLLSCCIGIPIIGLYLLKPEWIINIFSRDPEVLLLGTPFLVIAAFYLIPDLLRPIMIRSLRALNDFKFTSLSGMSLSIIILIITPTILAYFDLFSSNLGIMLFGLNIISFTLLLIWRFLWVLKRQVHQARNQQFFDA